MIEKYLGNSNYKLLLQSIENGDNVSVFGLNIGEKLALLQDSAILFYVVENADHLPIVIEKLEALGRNVGVISEPIDCFTSEFFDYKPTLTTLCKLKMGMIDTLVITPEILACKFPNPRNISMINIKRGQDLSLKDFIKNLISLNYKRVEVVSNEGEFSVRGDIIDIYSICGEPVRIYLDYDNVASIKKYNSVTMLTTADIDSVDIFTNKYLSQDIKKIDDFYVQHKIAKDDLYYEITTFEKLDYRSIVFEDFVSIFDYVTDGTIAFDGAKVIYSSVETYLKDFAEKLSVLEKSLKKILSFQKQDIQKVFTFSEKFTLVAFHYITEANRIFSPKKVFNIRTLPPTNYSNYNSALLLDINNYITQQYTIILCAGSSEDGNRIRDLLEKNRISSLTFARLSQCVKGSVNIVTKKYPLDILLPEDKLAIIATESLCGKHKKVVDTSTGFFDGIVPDVGDYVVHNYHGIGKCLGVQTLTMSGASRDYVVVEYKNNDKLFLPVENIDQLSKYMGSEKTPVLNRIGGAEFAKTKAKVKDAVKKIAFDLIALYRDRLGMKGYKYPIDDELQKRFENDFGYTETTDQLTAIDECKKDMENGKLMDRLICGDVGYGKTEIALRIAFKTILAGKQVALLCPTTILSEQHYNTAKARLSNYAVRVEVLNRLKSSKEITQIKKDISSGKIDLICGTHKLLAKDINYKNLGLLILDEEQKFGVADKEKIKNIRKQVNVLTLSATPIPRTLNMSLIGVRDISLIETPPTERVPSVVQVVEYDDGIIKSAIEKEIDRNGQILIIYNRVESIYKFASHIHTLCPNIVVSVAHGQMTDTELETEIFNLYSGATQVLVATTLIENGVDLPNANTLIVINADTLGLSQLYQLKGRVGRSDRQAFAYFTYDRNKTLTDNAYKRLQAISEFAQMGSGFKIAMRDLEIRGAGSLLGLEQSGHIEKIGYNMYVELLGNTVRELKGEKVDIHEDVRVETSISAYLSHSYVESANRRMMMYREISRIDTMEKFTKFLSNTKEVYGDLPSELVSLTQIALIKNICSKIGAFKISIKDIAIIYLRGREFITQDMLDAIHTYESNIILSFDGDCKIEIKGINREKILEFILNFMQLIINF